MRIEEEEKHLKLHAHDDDDDDDDDEIFTLSTAFHESPQYKT